jgi:hypothetical protein
MRGSPWILVVVLAGCADSIRPDRPDAGPLPDARDGEIVPTGLVTTVARGDGSFDTLIDGTRDTEWTGFDLDTGAEDPDAWDLGWMRASVRCNGGVSGTGNVEVAVVVDTGGLDGIVTPPTTVAYRTDTPDGDDGNTDPDYCLKDWYDYDMSTHVLAPKPEAYVVRTTTGAYAALEILDYYDSAGTSAWYLVHWKPLESQ